MSGDILNQTETAELLGKSRAIIRRWTNAGILPHFRDPESGLPIYSRAALESWQRRSGELAAEQNAA